MTEEFAAFVKRLHTLKAGDSLSCEALTPNRRGAISTLQIALGRQYTTRTAHGKTTIWRLK